MAVVQPDGCRDLIMISRYGERDTMRVTGWDSQPHVVRLQAGAVLIGYRLCPGVTIAPQALTNEESNLEDLIESEAIKNQEIHETIKTLTQPGMTVAYVARQNGVTTRTLQRQFRDLLLPVPDFWRLLGRARRAAQALPVRVPLAEIAHVYGYSDQAHMTREFVRWFGCSPAQLRQNKTLIDYIGQPGLGNWLDESRSEFENLL